MTRRDKRTKVCPTCNGEFHPISGRFHIQKFCKQGCARRTDAFKSHLSKIRTGRIAGHRGKSFPHRQGAACHFWRGGVSQENRTERQNFESTTKYREFRRGVFARDNYTCQICGDRTRTGHKIRIQLDHIKPFLLFPELRMDENNVRTLCVKCHYATSTYGSKIHAFIGGAFL